MKRIIIERGTKGFKILIPKALYSREAILNCLYWYLDRTHVQFSLTADDIYIIDIKAKDLSSPEIENIEKAITNDIIDFELREIINRETKNVRELILAKAFANGALDNLK